MEPAQRVVRNTFYAFVAQFLNKIINAVFIIYSARLFGARLYGIFVLVNTMIIVSSKFTNLGIRPMTVRKMSRQKSQASVLLGNILAIRLCLSILVYILLLTYIHVVGYSSEVITLVYIAGIVLIFNTITDSFEIVYIAHEMMRIRSILITLSSLSFTALALIFLGIGYRLQALFIINVIVAALFAILSGYFIKKYLFHYSIVFYWLPIKNILLESLPFFCFLLLNILNTKLDIMMLSLMDGPMDNNVAIGLYAPAHNILISLMILPVSLNMGMLPMISQKIYVDHETVRESVVKATRFIMIFVSFPIILATSYFSKDVIILLFGVDYSQSAVALMILGWGYAFHALNIPSHSVLGSSKELKSFLPLICIVLIMNGALNYLLIPKHGFVGASVATSAVLLLGFIGRFYFLRRILEVRWSEIRGYLRLFAALTLTLIIIFLLKDFVQTLFLSLATIFTYLFFICVFKTFNKDEITYVQSLIKSKFANNRLRI